MTVARYTEGETLTAALKLVQCLSDGEIEERSPSVVVGSHYRGDPLLQ